MILEVRRAPDCRCVIVFDVNHNPRFMHTDRGRRRCACGSTVSIVTEDTGPGLVVIPGERPRHPLGALLGALALDEARASVALDGDTQCDPEELARLTKDPDS